MAKQTPNSNERVIGEALTQMIDAALNFPDGAMHIATDGLLAAARDWLKDAHWENGDITFQRVAWSLQGALALDERHHPAHTDRHTLISQAAELADTTAITYTATMADGQAQAACIRAVQTLSRIVAGREASHG